MRSHLDRRVGAEFFGTAFLAVAVIGSGIMGVRLAGGNVAIAPLANTVATGAALVALIITFGPISGAHLNPVVTMMDALEGGLSWSETPHYFAGPNIGGILGALVANWMFSLPTVSISTRVHSGPAQVFSEFVATFGLVCIIWGPSRFRSTAVPVAIAMYLSAAYWFTTSISFAHPAVTIARCLNNTFAGIRPKDAPLFILAQFVAWLAATLLFRWLALGFRAQAKQLLVAHEENRSIEVEAGQQRRHR